MYGKHSEKGLSLVITVMFIFWISVWPWMFTSTFQHFFRKCWFFEAHCDACGYITIVMCAMSDRHTTRCTVCHLFQIHKSLTHVKKDTLKCLLLSFAACAHTEYLKRVFKWKKSLNSCQEQQQQWGFQMGMGQNDTFSFYTNAWKSIGIKVVAIKIFYRQFCLFKIRMGCYGWPLIMRARWECTSQ